MGTKTAWLALALATPYMAAAARCTSFEECCSACGGDSYRCARGPCSTSFVTKGFFSISVPTESVGFWDVVLSFYGMVPYLVPIALALDILLHRRTWTRIWAFLFIPIVAVINAVILVKSLGDCAECARPCGSCVASKGMPSGHATNAIGLCLWILLETLLGVGRSWSVCKKALVILGSVLLFAPVPYSRVYLGDHTSLQVGIGAANGVVLSVAYFLLLRLYVAKKLDRWSQWLTNEAKWFKVRIANDFSLRKQSLLEEGDTALTTSATSQYMTASTPQW